jgi:integrase
MSILSLAKSERSKIMKISNPCIFDKGGMWYLSYREIFENGTYKKRQITSKVKSSEKQINYMTSKWLPAYWAILENSYANMELGNKTFGRFYEEYLNLKSEQRSFWKTKLQSKAALAYFGEKTEVSSITKLDVKKYINTTAKKGIKKDSVQAYFGKLNAILELAVDAGILGANPCFGIKIDMKSNPNKENRKPFEPWEVELLISKATGELKNYLGIAFNTGMSPEEIIALMPQDFDFEEKLIKISRVIANGVLSQDTKTIYRTRTIPLFDTALPYIQDQMRLAKEKMSLFLFSDENGNRLSDIGDMRGKQGRNTKRYGLIWLCKIEYRPLKNCRHTWAVQAIKSRQFTLQQIADILGHVNLRMLISHYADYIDGSARFVNPSLNVYEKNDLSYSLSYSGEKEIEAIG